MNIEPAGKMGGGNAPVEAKGVSKLLALASHIK